MELIDSFCRKKNKQIWHTNSVTCKLQSSRYDNHNSKWSTLQNAVAYSQLIGLYQHNKISCKPKSSIGQASILEWIERFQNTRLHQTVLKHMLPCENKCYNISLHSIQTPEKKQAHQLKRNLFLKCKAFKSFRVILLPRHNVKQNCLNPVKLNITNVDLNY